MRQFIFSRLAGYEDTNDAERLSVDPTMAEVAVPRELFRAILEGIERLRLATATSG